MVLVAGLLALGIALAVAALLVLREAGRLAQEPPAPVFDFDEAVAWVVEQLPDDVAATLTVADVRRILEFQLELFRRKGVAGNGSTAHPPGETVVAGTETVAYVLARAEETGEPYIAEQVHPVVETQLRYLRAIGAVRGPGRAPSPPPEPRPEGESET